MKCKDVKFSVSRNKTYKKRLGTDIQINRVKYTIVYCDKIMVDGESLEGFCDPFEKVLLVKTKRDVLQTLLHEAFHAELHEGGYNQREDWDGDLEDMLVEILSQSIGHNFILKKKTP